MNHIHKKKSLYQKKIVLFALITIVFFSPLVGLDFTVVGEDVSEKAAENWLKYINILPLKEKLSEVKYEIIRMEAIRYKHCPLCYIYHLYPRGHILVPALKELVPIKSFSLTLNFNSKSQGYEEAVQNLLKECVEFLSQQGMEILRAEILKKNEQLWRMILNEFGDFTLSNKSIGGPYAQDIRNNKIELIANERFEIQTHYAPPLLQTHWGQTNPYNDFCPEINGERCLVGCVATAMAQIMRYYEWPKYGDGSVKFYWGKGEKWLFADFSDTYDWDFMPNETWEFNTSQEEDAVAELCYEAGISLGMNYGKNISVSRTYHVAEALKRYFRYSSTVKVAYRKDSKSVDEWFETLREQRDLLRPVQFRIHNNLSGHSVVVDGYLITSELKQVHINMGRNGNYDAYYSFDNILDYTGTDGQYAVIDIIPLQIFAPLNFSGFKIKNRSLFQFEYIGVLNWEPNPKNKDMEIEKYRIYLVNGRNQVLLTEVGANIFEYWHKRIDKDTKYIYAIRAVCYRNREGEAAYLEIQ